MKKHPTKPKEQTRLDIFEPDPEPQKDTIAAEDLYQPEGVVEDDPFSDDPAASLDDSDPDSLPTVRKMKKAMSIETEKMIPKMYEKFLNADPSDSVKIFEAMADRIDLAPPSKAGKTGTNTMNNLILTSKDMLPMLQGLSQLLEKDDD